MAINRTKPCDAPRCDGMAHYSRPCAAYICDVCSAHVGLARCFCGWAASGGNGRTELIESGEVIDAEGG
jgi:hypothetical protein